MKKHIVILSAFLTPLRSGAEACAEEVPLQLKDQYNFTIVTARMRRNLPKRDHLGDIPVVRVGFGCTFDKWLFPFLAPLAVRKLKPDLIHAVLETFAGLALVFCRGVPRMLTMQTTNRSFLKGFIVRSPDVVTAISSVLVTAAKDLGRKDVTLIPNGIDLKAINDACGRNKKVPGRILFVGRLEPQKGVDTLLRAFKELKEDVHLRIVGDGSQRQKLEKMADDRVIFTGYIPSPKVFDEYAQAEIFCGLSRSEALGNVFLEAQAAGCVTMGTNVGGIPDILTHGKAGWLVHPDDGVKGVVEALQDLLSDENLRNRLITSAKEYAQQLDWSNVAKKYSDVYESVLSLTT